ncbi:MAG: hypothetical protein RML93_05820 [Anaerolineales bacterium]|nr:hypothetical protein [Anaerolineales bacterium]MCS7246998.1 hypothetical protein [Anaerolineales bacterium]MDW8160809.1 hypothetical protein [Anaerolineales bacterium]MDW8446794.1 hypothetical protein [Anaerolineales bacterium]
MRPPLFVTFALFGGLITGVVHFIGVVEALRRWDTLQELVGRVIYYILFSNFLLWLAALSVLVAIWRRLRAARWVITGYVLLFVLIYWLDRLVFFQSIDSYRWPFGVASQIVIGLLLWIGLTRKSVRAYFGEGDD